MAPACGGPAQSPINIDLHLVQQDPTLGPFIFQGYSSAPPGPWTLENDGHTGQYPGTRTPHRQEQEPPGSGSYCSPPSHPPPTGIKISTVSIRTATHIGKDTLNGGHEAPYTGVRTPPTIAISHCPLGPGVRTFPEVRAPPPAPGCPRSHHNPPISHIAVMGPNSSHRRATLSPILAGWIISPAVC